MADLDCKKPTPCEPTPTPKPIPCSEPFTLCIGDRTLNWDGFCLTTSRPRRTPDGTYTSVTVVNGCIVDYGYADEPTYTPPYCNPNPSHCQEGGGATSEGVKISPEPSNSLRLAAGGLFSRTYLQAGVGVTVSGTGSVRDPYIVAVNTPSSQNINLVARNGVVSEETSTGVTYVGLEESGVKTGVYDINDQFTVDRFGRIVAVVPRQDPLITAGAGLEVTNQGDSVQVKHPIHAVEDSMVLGAYSVEVNQSGHIVDTERLITLDAGIYNLGAYSVGINEFGSISSVAQRQDVMPADGSFTTREGKVISYDVSGRLVAVDDTGAQPSATGAPLPLRDMYKVSFLSSGELRKETYGNDTQMVLKDGTVRVTLPDYIEGRGQVAIHGVESWDFSATEGIVTINPVGEEPFTIAFRG